MVFDDPAFKAVAANITPDAETGIGKWTDAQRAKAIREGVRPYKSIIGPPMPMAFYRHMSDDDLKATITYLRAQPAVQNAVPRSTLNIPLPASLRSGHHDREGAARQRQARLRRVSGQYRPLHGMPHTPRRQGHVASRPVRRGWPGVSGPLG